MAEHPLVDDRFRDAIQADDLDRVEELWLDALSATPLPLAELLEVRRLLWSAGHKDLARTLLELLAEAGQQHENWGVAVRALSELVRLGDNGDHALLDRLEAAFATTRSDSPSLEAVRRRFALASSRRPLDTLDTMTTLLDHDVGTVVEVIGKGVGRVVDLNLELETVKVDLGGSRPISVPFGAVPRFLRRLPADDFRRRALEEPEATARFVQDEPGPALVRLLESLDGPSDVAAIRSALSDVLPADRWNAWWGKARTHPRIVTSGSGSRLSYAVAQNAETATEELLEELETIDPRRRLVTARRVAGRGQEATSHAASVLKDSLAALEADDPGLAWETAAVLADLPGGAEAAAACRHRLLEEVDSLRLLAGIEDRAARTDALEAIRDAAGDAWPEVWSRWLLREEHPAVLAEIASNLESTGRTDHLESVLEVVFRNHQEHPAQFIWACESLTEEGSTEAVQRWLTPSLLEKLPDAFTRREFQPLRSRAKALLEGGRAAVRVILEEASPQQAERFLARLTRIDSIEPERLRTVEEAVRQRQGAAGREQSVPFVATRAAVEARRAELKQLLEVEIPKTLKGIQAAAAEGDLRENFEYHMLRDRQELQSAKAARLQKDLARVNILEPGAADTSAVNVGTVIELESPGGDRLPPVTILGPWDSAVERRVFSAGSELAQRLLGHRVGDEVDVTGAEARISGIRAWTGDD
jgi:transcription elongation factor GreA